VSKTLLKNSKGLNMNGEPSLEQIDDYNGNESAEKRSTVNKIIIGLLLVGVVYAGIKYVYSTPSDYVGTPENPGINTARNF
jgi:hypothetical protein